VNQFQPIFDKQKNYFNTDATKSYEWRLEQLDRKAKMLNENNEAFQEAVSKDFKTALEEKVVATAWRKVMPKSSTKAAVSIVT
jgi:aldehyde dehydrogenase (NAD+)